MNALLLLASLALPSRADVPVPEIPFEKITLDNGLEVILSQDDRLPLVAVNIWYHVGGGNEVPGRSGFAHLFEHIMFQGSRNVPEDAFFPILEAAGAPMVNGTTDFDRTNYFETVPANQLELALWLESDRMGFLLDTLSQERLDNQKAVVRKERQQSVENVPYGKADERLFQLLFPAPHPYNGVVIGTHQDLEAATLADVTDFFRTWYAPNNATLAIVGDFDRDQALAMVNRYFAEIPAGPTPPELVIQTQPITAERREAMTDKVELPRVTMAWITPAVLQPGDAELILAGRVLAEGKSSRLYTELVEKQQIAQNVSAWQYSLNQGSVFGIELTGKPGQDPARLEAEAWKVVEQLREKGPTPTELTRALRGMQAQVLRGLESLGGFGGKADVLNHYNHFTGDPGHLATELKALAAVDAKAMSQALGALRTDNRVVIVVTPEESR